MYDLLIKNGLIVDGSRRKPFSGNVYIQGGKIAEISADDTKPAAKVYDAQGHVVAPGFVDIHTHSDVSYLHTPVMESMLSSGVTFQLVGQCGASCVPINDKNRRSQFEGQEPVHKTPMAELDFTPHDFASYAAHVEAHGVAANSGMLIGHSALRSAVIGWEMRQMTKEELQEMCDLLDEQLRQGAAGVSFGLIYPPGSFCDTEEIIALARTVARHDKLLAVHMRNENLKVFEALDEMISVAEATGVRLEISHLKLMGRPQWGRADELLTKVDLARARGVRIHCDQYPYTSSGSGLIASLPKWAMDGGFSALVKRLQDKAEWEKIKGTGLPELYNRGGPENVMVNEVHDSSMAQIVGKTLTEIAEMLELPLFEAIREVLIRNEGHVACFYRCMDEGDLLRIMARRDISVISDGVAYNMSCHNGLPHPRYTGTFPRFLRLVREHNLMPLEDAVYKITALPATIAGFGGRFGFLKAGYDATITVFDWDTVTDCATFQDPVQRSKGIELVVVNGVPVFEDGAFTAVRPGKVYKL